MLGAPARRRAAGAVDHPPRAGTGPGSVQPRRQASPALGTSVGDRAAPFRRTRAGPAAAPPTVYRRRPPRNRAATGLAQAARIGARLRHRAAPARVDGTSPTDAEHRHRIETVLHRADRLLAEFGAEDLAERSTLLDAGLRARLRTLASTVDKALGSTATAREAMETALDRVVNHDLLPLRTEQITPAVMAARLVRWLAEPAEEPRTVAEAIAGQARNWGWADRALAALWFGE